MQVFGIVVEVNSGVMILAWNRIHYDDAHACVPRSECRHERRNVPQQLARRRREMAVSVHSWSLAQRREKDADSSEHVQVMSALRVAPDKPASVHVSDDGEARTCKDPAVTVPGELPLCVARLPIVALMVSAEHFRKSLKRRRPAELSLEASSSLCLCARRPSSPESSLGRNRGMEWLCGVDGMPVSGRVGRIRKNIEKKAQLVLHTGLVTCPLLCRYRSWMLFRSPSVP